MTKKKIPSADLDTLIPILIGVWRRFQQLPGPPDVLQTREFRSVVEAIQELRKGMENKSLIGTDYFSNPKLLSAYLLYYGVLHYQEGLSLLNEISKPFSRVLDLCSGLSSFALAALKHGAAEVYAVDRNAKALELGAEIAGRFGFPLTSRKGDCLKEIPVDGKFDLIILGHCLEELFPDGNEAELHFIKSLINRMHPDGHLLLVERSELESNHRMLKLRDSLVNEGIPIQAPCVWQGECPALKTSKSPCFAQREFEKPYLIKEFQRASSINLGSLKMSYLLLRHPLKGWPKLENKPYYRVVSPHFENHQGKHFYLCGTNGKQALFSHSTQQGKETKAFDFLKRGELISLTGEVSKKGNTLLLSNNSKLQVEAACGKPIPEISEEMPYGNKE